MTWRRGVPLGTAVVAMIAACTTFDGGEPAGEAPDAGGTDAPVATETAVPDGDTPASDAGDAGSPNLFSLNGAELGCTGLQTSLATVEESPVANTGANACLVCGTATQGVEFTIARHALVATSPGDTYLAEMWVRAAPDASAPASFASNLSVADIGGYTLQNQNGGGPTLDGTYKRMTNLTTVTVDGGVQFVLKVGGNMPTGAPRTCFLIDDMALRKQ